MIQWNASEAVNCQTRIELLATVHAEQNAVADAARRGVELDGARVYVTHMPCITCAKILAASGIREIVYRYDYRNDPLVPDTLAESAVELTKL